MANSLILFAEDLRAIGFSCFPDIDALALSPHITFRFEAWYQSRVEIYSM